MLFPVAILALALLATTVLTHYEFLRVISKFVKHLEGLHRRRLVFIIFGLLAAHIIEMTFYGSGYWFAENIIQIGKFHSDHILRLDDYFYFSAETYTSVGIGDLYPTGDLRLIAGFEALNGLLLIGWSSSFAYLAMARYWKFE